VSNRPAIGTPSFSTAAGKSDILSSSPTGLHGRTEHQGATVVVLYHPSAEDIAHMALLAESGHRVIAIINAITSDLEAALPVLEGLTFIRNTQNAGLARALNQGLSAADEAGVRYVLLLDQDSRPAVNMIDQLIAAAARIEGDGRSLACVAPMLYDKKFGAIDATTMATEVISTGTFATSGTLITQHGWRIVGPMWDELFIDGIDHEWCFRARSQGLETVQLPGIVMEHDMGEDAVNFFGRFKPIHRSPNRHYFIIRNTIWLLRRPYIPIRWRLSEAAKLAYRIPAYVWFSIDRLRSIKNLAGAIVDGIGHVDTHQPMGGSRTRLAETT
jgi:rhamnosyltransferase